jgi:hypothetical protein
MLTNRNALGAWCEVEDGDGNDHSCMFSMYARVICVQSH